MRDGGFVNSGYSDDLDGYVDLRDNGKELIQKLQQRYTGRLQHSIFKIKYNNVIGYYIDVTNTHVKKVQWFSHRQTLVNSTRYLTEELSHLQDKILHASQSFAARVSIFEIW